MTKGAAIEATAVLALAFPGRRTRALGSGAIAGRAGIPAALLHGGGRARGKLRRDKG